MAPFYDLWFFYSNDLILQKQNTVGCFPRNLHEKKKPYCGWRFFYNMGNVGSERQMSRVCALCHSFVNISSLRSYTSITVGVWRIGPRGSVRFRGLPVFFASVMLVFSFLGCEVHLGSVFVRLVTSASGSRSKTCHGLLQRSGGVQLCHWWSRLKTAQLFILELNLRVIFECCCQENGTKKKNLIILIKVLHELYSCHNTLGLAFQVF